MLSELETEFFEALRRELNQMSELRENMRSVQGRCTELLLETREARKRIRALEEAMIWMSGSPSFAPGGEARKGFEELVLPLLRDLRG